MPSVTLPDKLSVVSFSQLEKASSPIVSTSSPIVSSVKQFVSKYVLKNDLETILASMLNLLILQPSNDDVPIVVIVLGMFKSMMAESVKPLFIILVTFLPLYFSGISILLRYFVFPTETAYVPSSNGRNPSLVDSHHH